MCTLVFISLCVVCERTNGQRAALNRGIVAAAATRTGHARPEHDHRLCIGAVPDEADRALAGPHPEALIVDPRGY